MTTAGPGAASRRPLPRRLAFRLAVVLSLGATILLSGAVAWNLHLQRQHLTRLVEGQAAETVEVIRSATRQAMLVNNAAELSRLLAEVAALPEIDRVRVFDKQGRISQSSESSEVGRLVDRTAEQCVSCHAANRPLTKLDLANRSRIFTREGGGRTLGLIAPIHNEPECANGACHAHSPQQTVLGVLDVQLPLDRVDASVATSQRQLLVGLVATALALLGLAGLLLWEMVLRPVAVLTAAAPRLAAGDFEVRVPERSDDELGALAHAWNRMAIELGEAHRQLADWSRTLELRVQEKTRELEQTHQHLVWVEKMASLGKLAASVAHELNNPLAGIATYAKLLRRRLVEAAAAAPATGEAADTGSAAPAADATPPASASTERILLLVEEESLRCGNIVKNLLLFSRTPSARFAVESVSPLVERCAMLVHHQFQLQNVELAIDLAPRLPPLECDAGQIQQMLLALTINALEATPAEGKVTIAARLNDRADRLELSVADTGRGMTPEVKARIFEPFFSTKEQGNGVGLGLAVVYGIIERHCGKIEVASSPGSGTVFTLDLPLRQPAAATTQAAATGDGRTP